MKEIENLLKNFEIPRQFDIEVQYQFFLNLLGVLESDLDPEESARLKHCFYSCVLQTLYLFSVNQHDDQVLESGLENYYTQVVEYFNKIWNSNLQN